MNKKSRKIIYILIIFCIAFYKYYYESNNKNIINESYALSDIPPYEKEDYIVINNNVPNFTDYQNLNESFESYGKLDNLGRCTSAYALLGIDLMPSEERKSIGMVKPSGWKLSKYDIVDGKYLYNRCHLIAYQLSGENANEKNLITCTRHTNNDVMTIFENKVSNYIRKTNNHVLYRSTPIFENDNLLASGIQIEALSIEDNGEGIKFNVYIYNVQPGIYINYKNGDNYLIEE